MKGYFNRIFHIDVTQKSFKEESVDDRLFEDYIGGKGIGTHLLLLKNPPKVDPLSPENHIIFAIGPVAGTPIWGGCRYGVYTKSPQSGLYNESYAGGTVAEYMAKAGIDVLVIRGASKEPVWIEIYEKGVIFHDASSLWGLDTYETERYIKRWIRDRIGDGSRAGVICIGPAGENLVSFSLIENDNWRSAGRGGSGAVLGSKKIKAIAFRGSERKEIANREGMWELVKEISNKGRNDLIVSSYKNWGTSKMVDVMQAIGGFPCRYWSRGKAEYIEDINSEALHSRVKVTPNACHRCFIACGRLSVIKDGRFKGLKVEGPEYETIFAFGGLCGVRSIEEIIYLNDLCDRLGMDTISAGNLVALTIEASEKGRIDYKIAYGDTEEIGKLLQSIAYREGIGDLIARGIREVSRRWDIEGMAMHVKGVEPPGYDPRILKGMALAYATSPRGACHLRTTFYRPELTGQIDSDDVDKKVELFCELEDWLAVHDCMILCRFYREFYSWERLSEILRLITGRYFEIERLKEVGKRIVEETRIFNIREGLRRKDDGLPERFYSEPLPETQEVVDREELELLVERYYQLRGWGRDGIPNSIMEIHYDESEQSPYIKMGVR